MEEHENTGGGRSGLPGWVLWIGILVGLNIVSQVLDLGFIIY
jgi:hypothetical protein